MRRMKMNKVRIAIVIVFFLNNSVQEGKAQ